MYKRINKIEDYIEASILKTTYSRHYSYDKTRYVELILTSNGSRIEKVLMSEIVKLQDLIEKDRLEACEYIYNGIKEEWENISSCQYAKEVIELNDYEFFENGEIYS